MALHRGCSGCAYFTRGDTGKRVMDELVIAADNLKAIGTSLLKAAGVPPADAELVADSLVEANLRGVDSHGMQHLGIYVERIRRGLVELHPSFPILSESDGTALIDGQNALGQVAAMCAMELAIRKARQAGIALVGVRHTNHCGMLAHFTMRAASEGLIGFASCNGPANMAPWGGKDVLLGNNPVCLAIPAGDEYPIVLDMATSVAAKGKIYAARSKGEDIPEGWALDRHGQLTTDAQAALDGGSLLPMGQHKGYGLALVMDVLAGLMTGSAFSLGVGSLHRELTRGMNLGLLMGALNVERFMPLPAFCHLVDGYIGQVKSSPPAQGFERVYLPGELEFESQARRSADGIPIPQAVWQDLVKIGRELGVDFEKT
jgi:LDH2 family malate/lactate/ureidoglycolate dehydrogenase